MLASSVLCAASLYGAAASAARAVTPESADSIYQRAEAKLATRATDDLAASLDLFLQAVRLDPAHARAHAGAATAASLLALYSVAPPGPLFATARAEAQAALALEPALAPARAAMGLVDYLDRWDFAAAESQLREALRLDPGYARAWHWYGMMLMATARFPESLAAFDHAIALEPESGLYFAKRAGVLAAAGRAAEAEPALRTAIERFPQSGLAQRELGYLLVDTGRTEEGVAALRRAAELAGDEETNADLAWGYARAGRRAEAEAIAERLRERWEKSAASAAASPAPAASATPASTRASAAEFVSPLDLALVYAGLGHADDAFRWLDSALALRDPGLVYLATAPGFATLRGDARFAALLRAIGLDSREPRQEGTTSAAAAGAAEADPR